MPVSDRIAEYVRSNVRFGQLDEATRAAARVEIAQTIQAMPPDMREGFLRMNIPMAVGTPAEVDAKFQRLGGSGPALGFAAPNAGPAFNNGPATFIRYPITEADMSFAHVLAHEHGHHASALTADAPGGRFSDSPRWHDAVQRHDLLRSEQTMLGYGDRRSLREGHLPLYNYRSHAEEAFAEINAKYATVYRNTGGDMQRVNAYMQQNYPELWQIYREDHLPRAAGLGSAEVARTPEVNRQPATGQGHASPEIDPDETIRVPGRAGQPPEDMTVRVPPVEAGPERTTGMPPSPPRDNHRPDPPDFDPDRRIVLRPADAERLRQGNAPIAPSSAPHANAGGINPDATVRLHPAAVPTVPDVPGAAAQVVGDVPLPHRMMHGARAGMMGAVIGAVGAAVLAPSGASASERLEAAAHGAAEATIPGVTTAFDGVRQGRTSDRIFAALDTATGTLAAGATVAAPVTGGASLFVAGVAGAANLGLSVARDVAHLAGLTDQGGIITGLASAVPTRTPEQLAAAEAEVEALERRQAESPQLPQARPGGLMARAQARSGATGGYQATAVAAARSGSGQRSDPATAIAATSPAETPAQAAARSAVAGISTPVGGAQDVDPAHTPSAAQVARAQGHAQATEAARIV